MATEGDLENRVQFLATQDIVMAPLQVSGPILDIGGGGEGVIGLLREDVLAIDLNREELAEAPLVPPRWLWTAEIWAL